MIPLKLLANQLGGPTLGLAFTRPMIRVKGCIRGVPVLQFASRRKLEPSQAFDPVAVFVVLILDHP